MALHISFGKLKNNILFYTRIFILCLIVLILAFAFVGIPLNAYGMSARPPVIPEQLEDGDYLEKSYLDNKKILIKDKDNNVKGYLKNSYIDKRKMLIFDTDGKVKGYLQRDLMDSRKLRFVKE